MPDDPEIQPGEYAHLLSPLSLAVSLTRGTAKPYIPAKHLVLLNDELVALHAREPGYPRRLMVMMPPRHGKSELISHWFNVWNLALDPTTKIIETSYAAALATKYGRMVKATIQQSYPMIGTRLLEDLRAGHRWQTKEGGGMESRGVRGGITGFGFKVGIIDDPIADDMEAQSKTVRDGIWNWWETTFRSRADPGDPIFVLVQTRWNESDLAGMLLESEPELWRVVKLPALAEANDPLGRELDEPLWDDPKYGYPKDKLEPIRQKSPRVFNALYQQNPAPPEGAALNRKWWRFYTKRMDATEFDVIVQTWDTTFKAVASSDFVAGWILGLKGSDIFILDGVKERLNTPQTMKAIKNWRDKWPKAKRILIEEAASGPAIIQLLEHTVSGITPISPQGRSKESRLHWETNSVAGFVEAGHVFLPLYDAESTQPLDPKLCDVAMSLVDEAAAFPFGANDDQLDAFVQGTQWLMPKVWSAERRAEREAEAASGPTTPIQVEAKRMNDLIQKRMKEHAKRVRSGQRFAYTGGQFPGWTE